MHWVVASHRYLVIARQVFIPTESINKDHKYVFPWGPLGPKRVPKNHFSGHDFCCAWAWGNLGVPWGFFLAILDRVVVPVFQFLTRPGTLKWLNPHWLN